MPVPADPFSVEFYSWPSQFPDWLRRGFTANEQQFNLIWPHALKCERTEDYDNRGPSGQWWLVVYTNPTDSSVGSPIIDFVLSCTKGPLDKYPIFIASPHPIDQLKADFIDTRVAKLVDYLFKLVPVSRVFSVYAADPVVESFKKQWTEKAAVTLEGNSRQSAIYYAALLTYCTPRTLSSRQLTIHPDRTYEARLAVEADASAVAALCFGFASESAPFTLSQDGALAEARLLIKEELIWVLEVNRVGQSPEIASIAAVTRTSETVAAITKVFTSPNFRKMRCAERLVRHVCKHYFKVQRKSRVILYVAHDNPAARKVYRRVGFVGLDEEGSPVEDVERWTEYGFDRKKVVLGHW